MYVYVGKFEADSYVVDGLEDLPLGNSGRKLVVLYCCRMGQSPGKVQEASCTRAYLALAGACWRLAGIMVSPTMLSSQNKKIKVPMRLSYGYCDPCDESTTMLALVVVVTW